MNGKKGRGRERGSMEGKRKRGRANAVGANAPTDLFPFLPPSLPPSLPPDLRGVPPAALELFPCASYPVPLPPNRFMVVQEGREGGRGGGREDARWPCLPLLGQGRDNGTALWDARQDAFPSGLQARPSLPP